MSWEDLSPAQWRMLERIRDNSQTSDAFNGTELRTAEFVARKRFAEWCPSSCGDWLTITPAGRVALRLKKRVDELEGR